MKMIKIFAFLFGIVLLAQAANAQSYNWPEDEAMKTQTQEKVVLYMDLMKVKKYEQAKTPLNWLLKKTPELSSSIYINGAKIYDALYDKEKDEARKNRLADSTLWMYDMRIKYFNEKAKVKNYQALYAMQYYQNRPEKYEELFTILEEAVDLNENEVFDQNLYYYMIAINKYKIRSGKLTDEDVIDRYFKVMTILNEKMEKEADPSSLIALEAKITDIFVRTVDLSCELIANKFGDQFHNNSDDVKLAKQVMTLMIAGKCTDDPLFMEVALKVYEAEPTYALAKIIAIKYRSADNMEESISWYEKAIELTEENLKKADIYWDLAKIQRSRGLYSDARSYAYKTMEADPSQRGEALTFIGDLYFGSFNRCAGKEDLVKDYAVFGAAYDKYKAAGNTSAMRKAEEQFLTTSQVFQSNYKAGESIRVGCWIGETTNVYVRREQ